MRRHWRTVGGTNKSATMRSMAAGQYVVCLIQSFSNADAIFLGCTRCPSGYGVATRCSAERDTVCIQCGDNEWSPARHHLSECRCNSCIEHTLCSKHFCSKCSTCGEGMYVKRVCNAHRDTFCDACDSVNPTINADFTKKCLDAKNKYDCHTECSRYLNKTHV